MAARSERAGWQSIADQIWRLGVDESVLIECTLDQAYKAVEYQRLKEPESVKRFRFHRVGHRVRVTRWVDRHDYDTDNWQPGTTRQFGGQNSDRWRLLRSLNASFVGGKLNTAFYETVEYNSTSFVILRVQ
jgi:hypothetical protein